MDEFKGEYVRRVIAVLALIAWLLWAFISLAHASPADDGKALSLVPDEWATHWAAQSGTWSDPATWETGVPNNNARVVIPIGCTVTQDVDSARLKTLRIDGVLQPADGATVTLTCETIVPTMSGRMVAGSSTQSFDGNWRIVFADFGPLDTVADKWKFTRGLLSLGKVELYGAEKTAYREIEACQVGDSGITLKAGVKGWQTNDRIVIPGVGWKINDDDEAVIGETSSEGAVRLVSAARHVHASVDRGGFSRPLVAANIAR